MSTHYSVVCDLNLVSYNLIITTYLSLYSRAFVYKREKKKCRQSHKGLHNFDYMKLRHSTSRKHFITNKPILLQPIFIYKKKLRSFKLDILQGTFKPSYVYYLAVVQGILNQDVHL